MKKLVYVLMAVVLGLLASRVEAGIIHVQRNATGPGDGLSWATAFTNVQAGINAALPGDQVWVAAGLYKERITLKDGVALYGGFAGGETSLGQRNWKTNASILDGNQMGTVITVPADVQNGAAIDGLTVQNGYAPNGGGIYCSTNAAPIIANCRIFQNVATNHGGGIACVSGSPIITNNVILRNQAMLGGAGIDLTGSNSVVVLENNRIVGNWCTPTPYVQAKGAGIYCLGFVTAEIVNNHISGNHTDVPPSLASAMNAHGIGGGIYCAPLPNNTNKIINNTIVANGASVGGGIYCESKNIVIANNIIAFGWSSIRGVSGVDIRNNCIYGNGTNEIVGIPNPVGTAGNISADPLLSGDGVLLDVHLQPDSPCRDAGDTSVALPGYRDIDGQPRVSGVAVDIGAAEWDGTFHAITPTIVRVSSDGDDKNDGASWATAKRTLQAGLDAAAEGGEVWVKAGTYAEQIKFPAFVSLMGGFGGVEINKSERNWKENICVLDTSSFSGIGSTITMYDIGTWGRVDGMVIKNPSYYAVLCINASPLLANNLLTNCVSGGLYMLNSSLVLSNNLIAGNVAEQGGGVYCDTNSSPLIIRNVFKGNAAKRIDSFPPALGGGAIYSQASSPVIVNNLFENNVAATRFGFPAQILGGAIAVKGGQPQIINNTFLKNISWVYPNTPPGSPTDTGGAIYCDTASALIANNLVAFNTSGMKFGNGIPQLRNNCAYGNSFFDYQGVNPTGANGNVSVDPLLTGPYGDVHLTSNSPCRDAGDMSLVQSNWLDVDGNARVTGSGVDIGADEYDGTEYQFSTHTFRVSSSGNDSNDGSSWSQAMRTINAAVSRASIEGGEVWVQKGFYQEVLRIPTFVYVYGGFAGMESERSQRDWDRNMTIIDGKRQNAVVSMYGGGSYSSISGCTLQNGGFIGWAGGVYCAAPFSGSVENNRINNCQGFLQGGGVYVAGNAKIINNIIASNSVIADSYRQGGGGISCGEGSSPLIANNTIISNRVSGLAIGGIFSTNASPIIANNIIAFNDGGVMQGQGSGGMLLANNCVYGNGTSNYVGVVPGGNDISVDPQVGDITMNYALKLGSPCIDVGDGGVVQGDWLDIYGRARVQGTAVDIGAYESSATAEWLPFLYSPEVTVSTVGGISYAQYSTVFTNDGLRVVSISPVTQAGTNFTQEFRFEWFTGPTSPASNVVAGTAVLGALPGGNYVFTRSSWGDAQAMSGFSVPTNAAPTLTSLSATGSGLQMNVAGVSGVNYVVLTSTNLVDWSGIYTNYGGPFVFTDSTGTNSSQRFYRVQIVP